ncbi:MAG: hypothetical protein IPN75_08395 [Dechloromonas sp.]|uniref:Uncharacterized protein n=1 Tax=Candidatus Dechloromonas phosphorivorans TaxID=2899244 RepID=A0A9D7LSL6_9RHOO|nr:hypothetical protein [Candidatus Dechloromonas phosphorivorans]
MLDRDNAAFIQTGVSISLAACGPDRLPSMSRGLGCRLEDGGRQVSVFLRRSQSLELIGNILCNGRVANVFSLPSSNRTLQLKGTDARITPFVPDDLSVIERHVADFIVEVLPLGMCEAVVRAILAYRPDDLVTVTYSPSAVFSQTPGPKAGERLG